MAVYALIVDEVITRTLVIEPEMVKVFEESGDFVGAFEDITEVSPRPGVDWIRKGGKKWQAPEFVPAVTPEPVVEDGVELPGTTIEDRVKATEDAIDFLTTMMLEG